MSRISLPIIFVLSLLSIKVSSQCSDVNACNFGTDALEPCMYVGDPCDDSNELTNGETYNEFCNCVVEGMPIPGCTEINACNFSTTAQLDDGSCIFPGDPCEDGNGFTSADAIDFECNCKGLYNVSLTLTDEGGDGWDGTILTLENIETGQEFGGITLSTGFSEEMILELPEGCYEVSSTGDLSADEVSYYINVLSETGQEDIYGGSDDVQIFSVGGVSGCTDPLALNYNPEATCETGDCFFCLIDGECGYSDFDGISAGPCDGLEICGPGNYQVKGTSYSGHLNAGECVDIPLKQPPSAYDIRLKDDGSPMTTDYGGVSKASSGDGHNNCVYVDIINCKLIYYVWNKTKSTLSMNDSENTGWQGISYSIKDENFNELYSGSLSTASDGNQIYFGSDEFDLEDGCYFLSFESDSGEFPEHNTFRLDNIAQGFVCGAVTEQKIRFSVNSSICVPGCTDSEAINFNINADVPCLGTNSCCKYPPVNAECSGATELISGELVSWSTEDVPFGQVPLNQSAFLWYSYQPSCTELVSFAGTGSNGFEFCLFKECPSEENLTPIFCSTDNSDNQNQGGFRLEFGSTYYWKIMSNFDMNQYGKGQLKLESRGCLGCTQEDAFNFNEEAVVDDGSCRIQGACVGDMNGDLMVTAGDLTIFLSSFGQDCTE